MRNLYDFLYAALEAINNGQQRRTRIMYAINSFWPRTLRILDRLIQYDMISYDPPLYHLRPKAFEYMRAYRDLQALIQ